jgi:hypothetical protein
MPGGAIGRKISRREDQKGDEKLEHQFQVIVECTKKAELDAALRGYAFWRKARLI